MAHPPSGGRSRPYAYAGLAVDPSWVPVAVEYRLLAPAAPPGTVRGRGSPLPRWLAHSLVLAVIVAVAAGRGYWGGSQPVVHAGGVDQIGDLSRVRLPSAAIPAAGTGTLASSSAAVMAGYMAQVPSDGVPPQLDVQTVVAQDGDTIAGIADQTGRSVDTLLWANGVSDPAGTLAAGTQVRVPPVDGMLHVVHDGDTLESIAARYQVEVAAITGYTPNNVQSSSDLVPYHLIMVPGGKLPTRSQVVTYTVREGDTLATIAQSFGLRPSTIVWANSLPNGDLIFPGQHLAILPTDGVMVSVAAGDTVESLAQHFAVDARAIRDYPLNGLGASGQPRAGQQVMVPGGQPPAPPAPAPQQADRPAASAPVAQAAAPAAASGVATGHFIWPTKGVITQYFGPTSFWMEPPYAGYAHFHQGVDIANDMDTPIVAADGGTVIYAGWSNVGLGNCVAIDHGNGFVTWYGHMARRPAVSVGQRVAQGQYIGPMGSTGASSGPHTHFAMLKNGVLVDPLAYLR